MTEVPVIVRDMDDDVAKILVVDSNLQRENILPSEAPTPVGACFFALASCGGGADRRVSLLISFPARNIMSSKLEAANKCPLPQRLLQAFRGKAVRPERGSVRSADGQ